MSDYTPHRHDTNDIRNGAPAGAPRRRSRLTGPHPPHRSHPLRPAPQRRTGRPHGARGADPLRPAAARGRGGGGARRTDGRHPLRVDRRRGLPPPRERRHGLHPRGERHEGGRGRIGRRACRISPDARHPRGAQRRAARPAPQPREGARHGARRASCLRELLPLRPEQTVDPRLQDRPRARHGRTRLRHARPEDRGAERLQLRRTRRGGLRHLLASGQAARLRHARGDDPGPLGRHGAFLPLHLPRLREQMDGGRRQESAALQGDALHAPQRSLQRSTCP